MTNLFVMSGVYSDCVVSSGGVLAEKQEWTLSRTGYTRVYPGTGNGPTRALHCSVSVVSRRSVLAALGVRAG